MASSNQYSWGLKIFLASLVLFFIAVTVESRPVSLTAPLLPEFSGANKNTIKDNKDLIGTSIAYVASRTKQAFTIYAIALVNEDPSNIEKVALFYTGAPKNIIATFNLSESGFYTYRAPINLTIAQAVHHETTSVGVWLKDKKDETKSDLVIAGQLANNRTTFISYLKAREVTTKPTGVSKNDGFGIIHSYLGNESDVYYLTGAINYDLEETVSAVTINGPSPSGLDNTAFTVSLKSNKITKGARLFRVAVNSTVFYWMSNHLLYLTVTSKKNPSGALRGQILPTTNQRIRIPVFPNGAQEIVKGTVITFLKDGSSIIGNLSFALTAGGARIGNKTIGIIQDRVAYFLPNGTSFNYIFQIPLPVPIVNKYLIRGALVVVTAAAEVVDNAKWVLGLYNLVKEKIDKGTYPFPGLGNTTYTSAIADLGPFDFQKLLGPGGVFVPLNATGVANPLFVDRFYVSYSICSATVNNLVRNIFFDGSDATEDTGDDSS